MIEHSPKAKGFLPVKSGPNLTGFYMGNSPSLMDMMQTGGPATRGGAALAQALQQQSDIQKLEEFQKKEGKRQGKGRLFGSIAKTVGGLLGSTLGPVGAGIGAGLGQRIGEGLGAGKSRSYDASGTVFGQQAFRDVDEASKDYTKGLGQRALVGGLEAGIGAALSPEGLFGKKSPVRAAIADSYGGVKDFAGRVGDAYDKFTAFDIGQSGPDISSVAGVDTSSFLQDLFSSNDNARLFRPGKGGGFRLLANAQDGGLLGMQTGGFTAESVLQSQGLAPTSEQLALFQQFDPTGLQSTAQSLRMGQISGARQARQQQAGTGFAGAGGVEQAQSAIARAAQRAFGTAVGQEQQRFVSDTLGTAADIVAGGGEFRGYFGDQADAYEDASNPVGPAGAPTSPPAGGASGALDQNIGTQEKGPDGQTYEWNGSSWVLVTGGGGTGTGSDLGGDMPGSSGITGP